MKTGLLTLSALLISTALLLVASSIGKATSPYDDEFNSSILDQKWDIVREDSTHWSLTASPGYLRIITQSGDIYEEDNTAKNIFLQEFSAGDFEIRTRILMSPEENFQQGGLVIYGNDDNYVRFTYAYINGPTFEFAKEINGDFQPIQVPASSGVNDFHLRIIKVGTSYFGYYSQDGNIWTLIGLHQNVNFLPSEIGLVAFNSFVTEEITADFDYFRFISINYEQNIILPTDGQVVVNFIGTGGPGDPTTCDGDFGLYSPQEILIYPNFIYFAGLPFPVPGYFTQGTELVFYITPRDFCSGSTFFSTDPNRAHVIHPNTNTWIISWEDWIDEDFNDLVVKVDLAPAFIPFLDLPYDYTGSTFANESRDTEQLGKVNAYFDHQYPTYSNSPNATGYPNTVNFYGYDSSQTGPLPPYKVVYNGHDGIDYFVGSGTAVLAPSSGTVTFVGQISGYCWLTGGTETANVIKIQHDNGYVTEYWHLSSFAAGLVPGTRVTRDPAHPIGYSGNTGCSSGPHLHFAVRNPSGIVVDPYGWKPLPDAAWYGMTDPWQQYKSDNGGTDAKSHYLWIHQLDNTTLLSLSSTTVITSTSGNAVATFPVGAYDAPLRAQMVEGFHSARIPGHRSLYTFSLFGYTTNNVPVMALADEITLDIYMPTDGMHAITASNTGLTPTLQIWNAQNSTWLELSTIWDPLNGIAHANSSQIGTFALTIPQHLIYLPTVGKNFP